MRANGFEPEFAPDVMREVGAIALPDSAHLTKGTLDLRALPWSSIDNRESRDLDQIEASERLPDGAILVRIGVADVESLVPLGSHADVHAAANATSVYTGVATFPMLPERLSTDLTSLNEAEDRLAVVIGFVVATDGALRDVTVSRALVRNTAKLVYEDVGAWLDGKGAMPRAIERQPVLREQLLMQDEAAQRLRSARNLAGALNFESVEASPVVVNGKVIDLAIAKRNRARDLIEDFMVAANRAVAMFLVDRGSASLRRVVREPKRWDRIVALAEEIGDTLPDAPDNRALAQFLERRRAADPAHFADLSLSVVKLLGPGVYVLERRLGDRKGAGHFGLAVADYVHSTAPNRRFADLVTQRMLRAAGEGGAPPYTDDELIAIAARCTERGEAARKVERTMRKVIGASMLAERVGESFAAIVTASSPKGVYARVLSPPVEGRVVRGGRGLDVGDTVRLKLLVADAQKGYIDFAHEGGEADRKRERSSRKKAAADRMHARIGETFDATVTGVSASGTYVRLADGSAEGRVVRGFKSLSAGMVVKVKLVDTDSVHGFIDFEHAAGVAPEKEARLARKRAAALALQGRVGEHFQAVVTGVFAGATWIRIEPADPSSEVIEGRLVRGRRGLAVGDAIGALLLTADPERGFIDFAREDEFGLLHDSDSPYK
ncbi:MAG: ribonuclease [Gemmatimonadetes bacterium]|nr:ribonuclease [Gemmatimonadota bacterium]